MRLTRCTASDQIGGGTGWFTFGGNIVPGEVFTLRLLIWDTGDGSNDSVVLLDGFEWVEDPITSGIQ